MRSDKEKFRYLAENFVKEVVGVVRWLPVKNGDMLFSDKVTPSDEAFARLCIENYSELCKKKATLPRKGSGSQEVDTEQGEGRRTKKKFETGRWTRNGEGTKSNGGWLKDGTDRFNKLLEWAKADRCARKEIEEELKDDWFCEFHKGRTDRRKRKRESEEEVVEEVEIDFECI